MKQILFALSIVLLAVACQNADPQKNTVLVPRDTTINVANSYTELFFDSTRMENYVQAEKLPDSLALQVRNFYNGRNYQMAWFDSSGLTEYAYSFLQMQNQYISYAKDSSIYNPELHHLLDTMEADSGRYQPLQEDRTKLELLLTSSFFRYAAKAYQGNDKINARDLGWYIPRKKLNLTGVLDSLVSNKGKDIDKYDPVYVQYNLLRQQLLRYYELEKEGAWQPINLTQKSYKPGDSSVAIGAIRKRLQSLGDLKTTDTLQVFDSIMVKAVKQFQRRYGIKEDGVIGTSMIKELNRPIEDRIRQLLVNMERMRWVPANPPADYLLVNIPAYQLFVYKDGKLNWKMNVVVGSAAHNTVIFRGDMKYIVFSPYWNVPNSIVQKEILPGIRKNKNYLARHNMEMINGSVRQKPGPGNSLGLVKFLFPNSYNIYLHDTPAKSLFNETSRAFSHGCIRLAEPRKLALYLLEGNKDWPVEKIDKTMKGGKETWVTLPQTIPVFIGYFTAWVDSEGLLNFRDDIYGHDKKMAEQLFGEKTD